MPDGKPKDSLRGMLASHKEQYDKDNPIITNPESTSEELKGTTLYNNIFKDFLILQDINNDVINESAKNVLYENVITINNQTVESRDKLRLLIERNKSRAQVFFYIVQEQINNDPAHWFSIKQEQNRIYIFDSLGADDDISKQIFDSFIVNYLHLQNENDYQYFRSYDRLQYSSGACEMYSILFPFFVIRQQIFNVHNKMGQSRHLFENNQVFENSQNGRNYLNKIFFYGLNEQAYGMLYNEQTQMDTYELRFNILKSNFEEIKKIKFKINYNYNKTFNDIFEAKLLDGMEILEKIYNNKIINASKYLQFFKQDVKLDKEEHSLLENDNENTLFKYVMNYPSNLPEELFKKRQESNINLQKVGFILFQKIKEYFLFDAKIFSDANMLSYYARSTKQKLLGEELADFKYPFISFKIGFAFDALVDSNHFLEKQGQ